MASMISAGKTDDSEYEIIEGGSELTEPILQEAEHGVQLGSWQSYHIVLQLKAETFSATMCLFPRTTTSSIPAVYIDPVKWPRQQVGEDFQAIAQRYGAMNLVVHVPSIDPKYKIALLLSKQDHCLVEMLNRWQDGKLPVDITCVIRIYRFVHIAQVHPLKEDLVPGAEGNFVFIMHSTRNQRKLRLLPEAFGRIQGLLVLDLSNNQLQVTSCSFCNHNLLTLLRKG
ncbi:hypothetical protein Bca101_010980 [Brassica carinata]